MQIIFICQLQMMTNTYQTSIALTNLYKDTPQVCCYMKSFFKVSIREYVKLKCENNMNNFAYKDIPDKPWALLVDSEFL